MKEKGYGLFTTVAMIIGVVIGSGIFFKSDNILVANSEIVKLPNIIAIAAIQKTNTPNAMLPLVATRILSLLKNIPEPITTPIIIAMVVNKP